MFQNYVTQLTRKTKGGFAARLGGFAEIAFCPIGGELFVPHGEFLHLVEIESRTSFRNYDAIDHIRPGSSLNSQQGVGMNFANIT
jgi:hypothetical protein